MSNAEKPVSVELSCGAGPSYVVLEPGLPLLLDCNLGASDAPFNVTWLQDGQPLPLDGADFLQYLANGSLLLLPSSKDGHLPQGVEGGYSCVSASALGALTSRTVNVLLASRWPAYTFFKSCSSSTCSHMTPKNLRFVCFKCRS